MRSAIVLAVAVVGLVVAGLYGVLLLREDVEPSARSSASENEGSASAWSTFRVTDQGLVVEKTTNPCTEVSDVAVEETDERVVVTVFVETEALVCTELAVTRRTRVELAEPLGSRRVYDGSCLARDVPERSCVRKG